MNSPPMAKHWLVRSQATIGDVARMRATVPHYSIVVLTSERAHITDPRAHTGRRHHREPALRDP
ncbi:MAG: hypothetical protein HYX43_16045 [Burkholderiales bacterium]|nr:hypothetical protein [Burkholderiales bacterium]